MLKIYGKNNNQLIRASNKATYSMPQPLPFDHQVRKCACGYDFIAIITTANSLYFLYQAAFYPIDNLTNLLDIATSENTITAVSQSGEVYVWDFDYDKVIQGSVSYTKVKLSLDCEDSIKRVEMGSNDIFLLSQEGKVYHFRRNEWYETKTYSNIESLELSQKIVQISSGTLNNLFLTYEGEVLTSSKQNPLYLDEVKTKNKFIKVATSNYCAGITKKGVIMIWGKSIHGTFEEPTEFYKLTKKFIDIWLDPQNGYAIADDGEIWVWGTNAHGELGISDYEMRKKPFPMITLEDYSGIQIFCGEAYTCCLCYPNQKDQVKLVERKKETFRCQQHLRNIPIKKNSQDRSQPKKPSADKAEQHHKREVSKCRNQHTKKSPSGSQSPAPRSQSPVPRSTKKPHSPAGKSYKKVESKQSLPEEKKGKKNGHSYKDSMGSDQNWAEHSRSKSIEPSVLEQSKLIKQLQQENESLKEKVTSQNEIIRDITQKIRMLEQAIDEFEKSLTSRDHVLEEYQQKEKEYIEHINELQDKVDEIVRSVNKNNDVTVVYENMKEDFDRERGYYLGKLQKFEEMLNEQREHYTCEIALLKEQLRKKEARPPGNKQNSQPSWDFQSPINHKSQQPYFSQGRQQPDMDNIIERIESNKSRINKSANKLIAMLDMSN